MAKTDKRILILKALEDILPGKRFHEITLDEMLVLKGLNILYHKNV